MHVIITENGRKVLNNKELSFLLVESVTKNKEKLNNGERVPVKFGNAKFKFALTSSKRTK